MERLLKTICLGMRGMLMLVLLGLEVQAEPEPPRILTIKAALEWALSKNPELAGTSSEVQVAEGKVQQAGAWLNPTLDLEAEDFGGGGARTGYDEAQTTARLVQTIELGGKKGKRLGAAQTEVRLANWEYRAKRLEVLMLTKKAFVDVLLAQGQLNLSESLLSVAVAVRQVTTERVMSGKVSPLEETKAGVQVAAARIARDRAGSELEAARKRLAASWGDASPLFKEVGGDLDAVKEVPPLETLSATLDHAPEVARWVDEVALGRKLLALAKAERIPDVSVSVGIRRFEEDGSQAGVAGVSLPLPVFNRNTGGIFAAQHQVIRAEYVQRAARLRLATELAEAYNRLATARTEALTTRAELLPGAQQAFDAAQIGYREGKVGHLEVLDTQRTLSEAKVRYLEVLAAYHKAAVDVERLTGSHLDTIQ